jgi:pilus biogenesis lipoprotein CpaD
MSVRPLLLAAAVALAGCAGAPDLSGLPEQQTAPSLRVERTVEHHVVSLDVRRGEIAAAERDQVRALLASASGEPGAQLTLRGPQPRERLQRLALSLAALGLDASRHPVAIEAGETPGEQTIGEDRVDLIVSRYRVIVPPCPDWSRPDALGDQNTAASNIGCATAVNFSLMLADPRDLVAGRGSDATAAGPAADAVAALRAGKDKPIPSDQQPPNLVSIQGAQ